MIEPYKKYQRNGLPGIKANNKGDPEANQGSRGDPYGSMKLAISPNCPNMTQSNPTSWYHPKEMSVARNTNFPKKLKGRDMRDSNVKC